LKNKLLIAMAISTLILVSSVIAEELPNAGILPDSPLYPVKILFEKVHVWLTFNSEAKTKLTLHYAGERLSELNETIRMGKWQYVEKLKEEYENDINETEVEMNKTFGLGRNATALAEHVCNMTYKHILVLQVVLEKAPESAKKGLERAINASINGHENCLGRLEEALNETNDTAGKFNCTTDNQCANITAKCPTTSGYQMNCFIPENRTSGFCKCQATWKKTMVNCTDDSGCKELVCPMVLGNDTGICLNGRCACGAKWQLRNMTEWKERFGEEYNSTIENIQEKIKAQFETQKKRH